MDDCLSFSYRQLKSLLSHHNVPGHIKLTTKRDMCEELLRRNLPLSSSSPRAPQTRAVPPVVPDMSRLSLLPKELQLEILKQLDRQTILELCKVNKGFAQLCRDDQLWKHFVEEDFGSSSKLIANESWYFNYRIISQRQRKYFNLFTPGNLSKLYTATNCLMITENASNYLLELFKPIIKRLIMVPYKHLDSNYVPELLRSFILEYYTKRSTETTRFTFRLWWILNIISRYLDEDEHFIATHTIKMAVTNDDELNDVLNFTDWEEEMI